MKVLQERIAQQVVGPTARFRDSLSEAKAAVLMVARMAIGKFGETMRDQQEISALIADAAEETNQILKRSNFYGE